MKYFLRKLTWLLLAVFSAIVVNFVLPRLMPGDPATVLIHQLGNLDPAAESAIRAAFGGQSDMSLLQQFWLYFTNLLRGDLGLSVSHYPAPVLTVLGKSVPWTVGLVGLATVISFVLGTLLGTEIAWRREHSLSSAVLGVFLFVRSFPFFWLGLVLVYFFAFRNPFSFGRRGGSQYPGPDFLGVCPFRG